MSDSEEEGMESGEEMEEEVEEDDDFEEEEEEEEDEPRRKKTKANPFVLAEAGIFRHFFCSLSSYTVRT